MKDQKKTKKVRVKEGQIFPKLIKIKKDKNPKQETNTKTERDVSEIDVKKR